PVDDEAPPGARERGARARGGHPQSARTHQRHRTGRVGGAAGVLAVNSGGMKYLAATLLVLAACSSLQPPTPPPEEQDINATVLAAYNVISGPAGRRDWDRFQGLFAPGARLIKGDKVMTPEEFVKGSQPYFQEHGFFERPVTNSIERYGDIAHVWSPYESRNKSDDVKPFATGVNSFQLVRLGGQWKILTILWQEQ